MVVSMGMLGFVYLVLILGWIFIVLLLKCKKSLTNFNNMYTEALEAEHDQDHDHDRQQHQHQYRHQNCPSVHVIQLQAEDLESEEQLMNNNNNNISSYAQQQLNSYPHPYQLNTAANSSRRHCMQCNNWSTRTYPTDAIVNDNAAYTHDNDNDDYDYDENNANNTPPPSYEEVMRRPEIYLKMHQTSTNPKLAPALTDPPNG